jgi:peptidoglycan/LPS O-acetylase OafA/YrhL
LSAAEPGRTPTAAPRPLAHLDFLDALRGLAALWVILYHLILLHDPVLDVPRWASYAQVGGMGVTLFFLVSAFSLCYTWPRHQATGRPLTSFFVHRFFRIAPLFFALLLVSILRDRFFFGVTHGGGEVLLHLTFLYNLVPGRQESIVWAGWTIGVEMLFYILFPLIYRLADRLWKAIAAFVLLVLASEAVQASLPALLGPRASDYYHWTFVRHLPIFALGIVCYHAFELSTGIPAGKRRIRGSALLAAAAIAFVALQRVRPDILIDRYFQSGIVFALLLFGLALEPTPLLINPLTRHAGKTSYSIYLTHPLLIVALQPVTTAIYASRAPLSAKFAAAALVLAAVVLPIAAVSYRFVEKPGIRLGKWLMGTLAPAQRPIPGR